MKLDPIISLLINSERGCHLAKLSIALFLGLALLALASLCSAWRADLGLVFSSPEKNAEIELTDFDHELAKQLAKAHFFGFNPDLHSLPLSTGPYRLTGIIQSETDAKVILAEEGSLGKIYVEGSRLPNGMKVLAIKSKAVVLENKGQLELLPMLRTALEKQ